MFSADLDGKTLTFDVFGLRGSNFVMRDRQTESQWQQATGEAFEGPLKGKLLTRVPFLLTTWGEWRAQHPETLALVPEASREDEYKLRIQRMTSLRASAGPERKILRDDPRLPPHEQILGLEAGSVHKAYPLALLRKRAVVNDQVGSLPVLLIHSAAGDTTTAFSRLLKGRTLTFHPAKTGAGKLVDDETGSTWTPYGQCVAGNWKGEQLDLLTPLPSFWFSWAEFYPETEIFSAAPK